MRVALFIVLLAACGEEPAQRQEPTGHQRMLDLLKVVEKQTLDTNKWLGDKTARELRPQVAALQDDQVTGVGWFRIFGLGVAELWLGREAEAIEHFERAQRLLPGQKLPPKWKNFVAFRLGVAYLRLAETQNCCALNTPESCILPIQGGARHTKKEGSRGAIRQFTKVANASPKGSELRLGSRWLLNLAYMTLGEYPDKVPADLRLPPSMFGSAEDFPRFQNIAKRVGLDDFTLSGGTIADDFDNDGDLDLIVSSWDTSVQTRYHRNNGDGTFTDRTKEAGLLGMLGGLNLIQADFNNDGHLDFLILRGAWLEDDGRHPNSLLKNLGGGRFVDVTFEAGLGELHYPTQTAGWADYDNDGDLDLYIGNESSQALAAPSQLFRNNGDGTFTDLARTAGVTNDRFTKSVAWGDYNGDSLPDLYVSNLSDPNRLYRNNGDGTFTDVAQSLGMTTPLRSFPCWFWDYDNDGHLDLYVSSYHADIWHIAAHGLGLPVKIPMSHLWRGDGKGGFTDVAKAVGLAHPNAPMGANYGDLDNDGFLDFYIGTGYPSLDTIMPNVMYRNRGGRSFADITTAGGFAHIQKGHAVVFADLDHDGDQDVFEQMGGAQKGDGYYDVLYENPGFGNHWIAVRLVGRQSNRSAIGARIRVVVGGRSIYKHVNSGGSFGANPLRQTIGLGKAKRIERLEVYWPKTRKTQVFRNVAPDSFVTITENEPRYTTQALKSYRLGH